MLGGVSFGVGGYIAGVGFCSCKYYVGSGFKGRFGSLDM